MARPGYVPERGDFLWLNFDPRTGHEQAEHRPALVLSPVTFNRKTGLCIVCPATTRPKGYPLEVPNPDAPNPGTIILTEQIRCVDWRTRGVKFIQRVALEVLQELVAKLDALIINPQE